MCRPSGTQSPLWGVDNEAPGPRVRPLGLAAGPRVSAVMGGAWLRGRGAAVAGAQQNRRRSGKKESPSRLRRREGKKDKTLRSFHSFCLSQELFCQTNPKQFSFIDRVVREAEAQKTASGAKLC